MKSHFEAVNLPSLPTMSYVHLKVIPKCTNLQLLAITFESSLGSCICQAARKTIHAYPPSKAPSQTKHKGLKGHSSSCGEMFVDVFWHASTVLKGSDLPPTPGLRLGWDTWHALRFHFPFSSIRNHVLAECSFLCRNSQEFKGMLMIALEISLALLFSWLP